MSEQLTLHTAKICPFAHRVELALAEAKAGYTRFEIDLSNKPEWYAPKVNPASKVLRTSSRPFAYGGPQTSPELPTPESVKIAESLILVEFIADLYPESNILPKDPVQRAHTRFFIDVFSTKVLPVYMGPVARGQSFEPLWEALEALQELLMPGKTYAVSDEFTAADIAITPFLARLEVCIKNDIGAYKAGEGIKAAAEFFEGERFKRLREYYEAIKSRESFKATCDENYLKEKYASRFAPIREQLPAAAAQA
ncbi:glutathione S-transferase [Roridomyces roridus]|uniref:Glutathione S-transferase n=1 Tax=Roridomyces roridus TaxID=1738132 RepID=A0AAD7C1R5_9AGAR|nr:glutathione S-transferase [Roridomyces roridus]